MAPSLRQGPLPEGYYVDNFAVVLSTVVGRYGDLLQDDEQAFITDFARLSLPAQRLYVRLISRRGPCFRRDRLFYREIPPLDAALDELAATGFADRCLNVSLSDLLTLLVRTELVALLAEWTPTAGAAALKKAELIQTLSEPAKTAALEQQLRARFAFWQPLRTHHLRTFRLLFFGNLAQDWTAFVLRDLGVVRHESYDLRTDLRLFPDRKSLDDALHLRACRDHVLTALSTGELDLALSVGQAVLAAHDAWHPATRRLSDRIYLHLGQALERAGDPVAALHFYAAAERPPARERRARLFAKLAQPDQALALCAEIAAAPRDETERVFAPFFSRRLARQLDPKAAPRISRPARPSREIAVIKRPGVAIEVLALEALAADSGRGFFAENWLWKSLFGLAFWDLVFAPVAGAFQHPFQFGPLDLHSPDFYTARAAPIAARLAELAADPQPGARLRAVYAQKKDLANALVTWDDALAPHLDLALSCLTGPQLAWICTRFCRDPGRFSRGLPDLFVCPASGVGSRFELFEVKGPGDQLRPEQQSWIDYLNQGGIPTWILKVKWRDAPALGAAIEAEP